MSILPKSLSTSVTCHNDVTGTEGDSGLLSNVTCDDVTGLQIIVANTCDDLISQRMLRVTRDDFTGRRLPSVHGDNDVTDDQGFVCRDVIDQRMTNVSSDDVTSGMLHARTTCDADVMCSRVASVTTDESNYDVTNERGHVQVISDEAEGDYVMDCKMESTTRCDVTNEGISQVQGTSDDDIAGGRVMSGTRCSVIWPGLLQRENVREIAYEEQRRQIQMMSIPASRSVYKMAASVPVLKSIHRELLNCAVCQSRYNKPKLLPCFHSFCEACLLTQTPPNSLSITCPVCRHPSILPKEGVVFLPENIFIKSLMDIIDFSNICAGCQKVRAQAKCVDCDVFVCNDCLTMHLIPSTSSSSSVSLSSSAHQNSPPPSTATPIPPRHNVINICVSCLAPDSSAASAAGAEGKERGGDRAIPGETGNFSEGPGAAGFEGVSGGLVCACHDGGAFDYFCAGCETAICDECRSYEHLSHPTRPMDSSNEEHRRALDDLIRRARAATEALRRSMERVRDVTEDLAVNYRGARERVTESFEELEKVLLRQREAVLNELDLSHESKQRRLAEQSDVLERRLIATENCCRFTEAALLHAGDETQLLLVRKEMTSRLAQLQRQSVATSSAAVTAKTEAMTSLTSTASQQNIAQPIAAAVQRLKAAEELMITSSEGGSRERMTSPQRHSVMDIATSQSRLASVLRLQLQQRASEACAAAAAGLDEEKRAEEEEEREEGEGRLGDEEDIPREDSFLVFDAEDLMVVSKYLKTVGGVRASSESVNLETSVVVGSQVLGSTPVLTNQYVSSPLKNRHTSSAPSNLHQSPSAPPLPHRCFTNTPQTFTLTTRDQSGNIINFGRSAYTVKLKTASGGNSKKLSIKEPVIVPRSDRAVDVSYNLEEPGSYWLDIRLFGRPIRGSPFVLHAEHMDSKKPMTVLQDTTNKNESSRKFGGSRVPQAINSSSSTKVTETTTDPTTSGQGRGCCASGDAGVLVESRSGCQTSKIPRTVNGRLRGVKRPPSSPPTQRHATPRKTNLARQQLQYQAVVRVGAEGRGPGEFVNPQGVAVLGDRLIVADSNNNCVQVFSSTTGEFIKRLGRKGCLHGQLMRPMGVAITLTSPSTSAVRRVGGFNYLVADYETGIISTYSDTGVGAGGGARYVGRFGGAGEGVIELSGPKGICVDSQGRVIVVDNKGCCIHIYGPDGRLVNKFGTRGYERSQFSGPHYCAVTPNDDIVVTDFHHNTVKCFGQDGQLRFSFGSAGKSNGQFGGPTGVAVDGSGKIVVADWGNQRIQVFDRAGNFLSCLDTSEDPLYGPQGLAVTSDGHIIVADSGHYCFKIFKNTTLV